MMQDFGWNMSEVGDLTMHDVMFISDGWKQHPPLGAMVAGGLGIKLEKPQRATKDNMAQLAQFLNGK